MTGFWGWLALVVVLALAWLVVLSAVRSLGKAWRNE